MAQVCLRKLSLRKRGLHKLGKLVRCKRIPGNTPSHFSCPFESVSMNCLPEGSPASYLWKVTLQSSSGFMQAWDMWSFWCWDVNNLSQYRSDLANSIYIHHSLHVQANYFRFMVWLLQPLKSGCTLWHRCNRVRTAVIPWHWIHWTNWIAQRGSKHGMDKWNRMDW